MYLYCTVLYCNNPSSSYLATDLYTHIVHLQYRLDQSTCTLHCTSVESISWSVYQLHVLYIPSQPHQQHICRKVCILHLYYYIITFILPWLTTLSPYISIYTSTVYSMKVVFRYTSYILLTLSPPTWNVHGGQIYMCTHTHTHTYFCTSYNVHHPLRLSLSTSLPLSLSLSLSLSLPLSLSQGYVHASSTICRISAYYLSQLM